nr:DoxX family membrane protein [Gemmatimonadales bacterium]
MAHGSKASGMDHPAHWIALLRVVVGLYFAKSVLTKMTIVMIGGFLPMPETSARWLNVMPTIVARQAAGNPIGWYHDFLVNTVLPHAKLFAHLTAWGEAVVGLLLTLGLLAGLGALIGLWLVANYGLATQWM